MMLAELRILLDHVAAGAAAGDYTESIMDENVLGKPTRAARQKTAQRLRELYGVDPHCTLFRWLRHFWTADTHSQPMLAFLVAAARDPLLRETTPIVQEMPLGQSVSSTEVAKRLVAARELQNKLKLILAGEPPYDIFVRWKPIAEQPIGWNLDLDDGARINIRPFITADVLRKKPSINWSKDRGKEPGRTQDQYPWFWQDGKFTGDRINDYHLTNAQKRAVRAA